MIKTKFHSKNSDLPSVFFGFVGENKCVKASLLTAPLQRMSEYSSSVYFLFTCLVASFRLKDQN